MITDYTLMEYTILDLVPRTQYLISVIAVNEVSELAGNHAERTATISAITLPISKFTKRVLALRYLTHDASLSPKGLL